MQGFSRSQEVVEGWRKVPRSRIDCDGLKSDRPDPVITRNVTEGHSVTEKEK